ncbi:MAG: lipoyl synthase [Phycisphaerae bacterium]|jgi:lipoic acid synthetase|nr:lipoyl synthase [Phycisphaerae bacterium]
MSQLAHIDLGQCSYQRTLDFQRSLLHRVQNCDEDTAYLILVEHVPSVITLGRRARAEHILSADGIELIESQRGGDVTWHGRGQLVAYPIARLTKRRRTVHGYIRNLEEAIIALLARFGLSAERRDGQVGVWIDERKIAAIGVAVSRWVTYHGLSLNVSADIRGFDAIVPCGIRGARVTSISEMLRRDVPISQVKEMLVDALARTLDFETVRPVEPQELGFARDDDSTKSGKRLPRWLRKQIPAGHNALRVQRLIEKLNLSTVCQSAQCPNRAECFDSRTATFMILGDQCTRSCSFCAVSEGPPEPVDPDEPDAVARACQTLNLRHIVITSVTRDDLPDGGAAHFARVVRAVRDRLPESVIEILTPDFQGDPTAIDSALESGCDVFNHNIETVERLHGSVRPQGDYRRSLSVLARAAGNGRGVRIKSGLMVGLGETEQDVLKVFRDLRDVGCEILTIGQYLAPSDDHHPVERYVRPDEFVEMEHQAKDMGFSAVASGAFVRSSYRAGQLLAADKLSCAREGERLPQ